jgi:hypothetical protein
MELYLHKKNCFSYLFSPRFIHEVTVQQDMNNFWLVLKLLVCARALLSPASLSKLSDVINPFFPSLRTIHSLASSTA